MSPFDRTLVVVVLAVLVMLAYEIGVTESQQALKTIEAMGLMALGALIQRRRDDR